MIVDASAMLAIVNDEPERADFVDVLKSADKPLMSVANHLEVAFKVDRDPRRVLSRAVDRLIRSFRIEMVPVTIEQAIVARTAYRDFGRGSGHPAKLNYGDCFAYALATVSDKPLLYKGNDFVHTDIRSAV